MWTYNLKVSHYIAFTNPSNSDLGLKMFKDKVMLGMKKQREKLKPWLLSHLQSAEEHHHEVDVKIQLC